MNDSRKEPSGKRAAGERIAGERIAKVMARAGLCSRRDAERWIEEGRVRVNGVVIEGPALNVSDADEILIDGRPLPRAQGPRLWRYYKPRGLVTTARDEQGRDTVFDHLPEGMPRVVSVGRLDLNSEGLLLLTNDGALARHLELPATGLARRYKVRAFGEFTPAIAQKLKKGVEVDGVRYGSIEAELERAQGGNIWLTMTLREGKNREIRRVLGHFGMEVSRLIRLSYGPFELGDMQEGEAREVPFKTLSRAVPKFFG